MNQAIDLAPMSWRVEAGLPVRVSPLQAGQTLQEHLPALQQLTQAHLESAGGIRAPGRLNAACSGRSPSPGCNRRMAPIRSSWS